MKSHEQAILKIYSIKNLNNFVYFADKIIPRVDKIVEMISYINVINKL